MKKFFRNPSKVALFSLVSTIIAFIFLIILLNVPDIDSTIVFNVKRILIIFILFFLLLIPAFGFIYSFFIKGKKKILYILMNLVCISTISVFAFMMIMIGYVVSFGP
ncbi:hypothetical protein ACFFF5_02635 [Lederbergia wuyishanensis]|uniref:Cellulose synthase/poly-beta-1,6-N-acetylglucosamine synthase-like glycosyltransferase n=1 Tax=Lederbergia wuyishanensis TaxID=1347903 RepID=A0ABU0D0I0_9BACI|nr:hypothetical protein [Lederbergia wuyishanensis]MCJ8006522.1 hypothetical protein [Lederbergia wuyishanensis]MDQ0341899.1 cellulose synthase/poly-beta-1,6-N-acetylglucosamine synthase-like glycosyltransferase [Lederbergia wuyishanensis]